MNSSPTRSDSPLQREIGQTRPFRSSAQEAAVALLRTADVLRHHFARVLETYEVTFQQYNVLRILRGAGPEGLPTLDVAERLIERAPGITRMMDRLEERGWVRRLRCPTDRRQVLCFLTQSGADLLHRLDGPIDAGDEEAVAALSPDERLTLISLLERVRAQHGGGV